MIPLSVVIITFNEEKNIARCIESVQDIADEIIIVDSFSTDRTKEICEKYNVKFFQQKWSGYTEQKNYANSLSANDLILSLDADEAISEELKKSILKLKSTDKQHFVGQVNRLTNYCGKWIFHCGWYPDRKIRLFNRKTAKWTGTIHEKLSYPDDIEVIQLKGDLEHYSYHTIGEHIKQADKFTTITALEAFNKGKKSSFIAITVKPKWKFFRDFILKLGFLDGYYGYVICKISSFATFLKYTKLRQLKKENK